MIFSRFRWGGDVSLELSSPQSAYIYYRKTRFNLLTGFPESYDLSLLLKKLDQVRLQDSFSHPVVYHFYYELGLILMGLGHAVDDEAPLAIELEYQEKKLKKSSPAKLKKIALKSLERPSWSEYKEAFSFIQEELLAGNCYQVNLTYPFDFETEDILDPRDLCDFFFSQKLSAYAHATFLGDEMILSNSPECLFEFKDDWIMTIPIKGTLKAEKNWKKQWEKLLQNTKEEGELNMITDLLRNDLNRLEYPPKAQVLKSRFPLMVPGLLHQCSIISSRIDQPLSLLKTLESLFPGGSVTGAPKKRVMEIISQVERFQRGIYCGSTLLCLGKRKSASINIRTASLSLGDKLWRYGAGGGITLLSKPHLEFQEMESKVSSFLTLLKAPGY